MMETQGSIKLFGQVIFIDGEDHGDHEELVVSNYEMDSPSAVKDRNQNEAETEKFTEREDGQKKGGDTSSCKPPKKPEKILPCPRCNSMDTKFCYFNNYKIDQPRYFCRNCQRYWTAGGTMRNVPVGAGRRKSKSCSNSKHITISEATLRAVELACQEPTHRSLAFLNNGLVTGDGAKLNPVKEFHVPDTDVHPRKSAHDSSEEKDKEAHHGSANNICQVHTLQVPYFNGSSWLYQWNPAAPLPNSSYPVGFHLVSPYWGAAVSPPPSAGSSVAGPPSPLGKHTRGGDIFKQSDNSDTPADGDTRGLASVPKTMRIDNPDEVAKSSIWTTVGIKRDKAGGITKGGLYSAFHPKEHKKESGNAELAAILSANPAALARSLNYRESA